MELARRRHEETTRRAIELLGTPLPADTGERQRRQGAIVALLEHATREVWPTFTSLREREPSFCREALRQLADRHFPSAFAPSQLSEDQLAVLCCWLFRELPPPEESARRWRGPT